MAGLRRFAVLFVASSFGVLLLAASASSSQPPEVYSVVDETARAAPPGNDDGTKTTVSRWAIRRQRFYIGDVLDFKLSNDDSDSVVLLVQQGDYERCSAASPVLRISAGSSGDIRFTLASPGLFYFISGAPARCEAGQRMVVHVVDYPLTSGAAPTPALAPGTQPAATLSGRRRRRPLSIAEMQMVAGTLGFAAGFITMFLIVGLFICCWF